MFSGPECLFSAADTASPYLCSLGTNHLCGLYYDGSGTYIAKGITALCEGLKGSAVITLRCAAALGVRFHVNAP